MNNRDYLREIWTQRPPDGTIKPPEYPPRPDLFDEVEWGPYVTPEQAKLAYRLWSLPDGILGEEVPRLPQRYPRPNVQAERDSQDMHALVHNVYEHLMHDARLPKTEEPWDVTAQMKTTDNGTLGGWSYEEILASPHNSENSSEASVDETILIEGEDVLTARYWTVVRLQAELKRRGLEHRGKSAELRRRLHDHELQRRRKAEKEEAKGGVSSILPRTDLSQWGAPRQDDYMIKITKGAHFSPLDMYTWAISLSPYNPAYWVSRSYLYYQQSFFDLAIGDAYRAQLLCEVLVNPRDRNRQPGLYTRIWHAIEQHILQTPLEDGQLPPPIRRMRESNGVNSFIPTVRKALHNIMSLSLKALQCWHDYDHMEQYLPQRVVMPDRDMDAFKSRKAYTENFVKAQKEKKGKNPKLFFFEKRAGSVTARNYPYSVRDVDRTSRQFLERLNREILADSQLQWKRFEIREHHNQQDELGVYATEYIEEGRIIYAEEPSVRGHLNITRHVDIHNRQATKPDRCDNCHRKIAGNLEDQYQSRTDRDSILNGEHAHACACAFTVDEPTYFCPGRQGDSHEEGGGQATRGASEGNETCLEIARKLYHFRTCGRNWAWLHDAMRQNWNRHRTGNEKRPTHITHTFEDHGTVLSLALREVFDMTLLRRQRSRNPYLLAHELDELLPLQGERDWECQQFPFTLTANIQVPFDILLRLGVDIFRDLTFDTWVIQIVLRKLLLSVVPWDEERRDQNYKVDDNKAERIKNDTKKKQREAERRDAERRDAERRGVETRDAEGRDTQTHDTDESDYDPTFRALYLFPGFAMFNHTCTPRYNAEWAFDSEIPNRIVVWAAKGISPQDEIRIRYRQHPLSEDNARRILGDLCACTHCERRRDYRPPDETDESPSSEYGPSEPHMDPRNDGGQERGRTSGNNNYRGGDRDQGPARDDEEASTEIEDHETQPESNVSHEDSLETRSRGGSRQDSSELPQEESTTDVRSQSDPVLEKMTRGQVEAISRKRKRSADGSEDMELSQKRDTRKAFAGYKRQKPRDARAPRKSAYFQCRS
ncbi:hypothetical protein DTO166G4_7130 [Paecilomyces variotii]|nr:hypothetical protein DTO166G4_7130 [Paecilomyces variotii]KAJ9241836.1 hypothetical protein DTO166G5_912 [Paecilomyces variotii]KAJ9309672.1 hypothetical protein DTO217A2_962 [Paecilomyces variotii]